MAENNSMDTKQCISQHKNKGFHLYGIDIIYKNGTTDYLELYAANSHSSALALYIVGGQEPAHNYSPS